MSRYFPLFVNLRERQVLVVGGGTIAARRIRVLSDFAACIRVCAPDIHPDIRALAEKPPEGCEIVLVRERYTPALLAGADLVLACTDDPEVNRQVSRDARRCSVLVNNCSDKTDCDFYFPGISSREDVVVGINAGGNAHRLAKDIREDIDGILEARLGEAESRAGRTQGVKHVQVPEERHTESPV